MRENRISSPLGEVSSHSATFEHNEEVDTEVAGQYVVRRRALCIQVRKKTFDNRDLLLKKGFFDEQEPVSDYMKNQLQEQGWETLFKPSQCVFEKVAKEFYATIHQVRGDSVRVRGKVVDFSPKTINTHLGLPKIVDVEGNQFM